MAGVKVAENVKAWLNQNAPLFARYGYRVDDLSFYEQSAAGSGEYPLLESLLTVEPKRLNDALEYIGHSSLRQPERLTGIIPASIAKYRLIADLCPVLPSLVSRGAFAILVNSNPEYSKRCVVEMKNIIDMAGCPISFDASDIQRVYERTLNPACESPFNIAHMLDERIRALSERFHSNGLHVYVKDLYALTHPKAEMAFDREFLVAQIKEDIDSRQTVVRSNAVYDEAFMDGAGFTNLELFKIWQIISQFTHDSKFRCDLENLVRGNAKKLGENAGLIVHENGMLRYIPLQSINPREDGFTLPSSCMQPDKIAILHTHFTQNGGLDNRSCAGPSGSPGQVSTGDFTVAIIFDSDGLVITPVGMDGNRLAINLDFYTASRAADLGKYLVELRA